MTIPTYDLHDDAMIRLNGRLCIASLVSAIEKLTRNGYVTIISDPDLPYLDDWHEIELSIIARHEKRVRQG